jgi:hypothetical protein
LDESYTVIEAFIIVKWRRKARLVSRSEERVTGR